MANVIIRGEELSMIQTLERRDYSLKTAIRDQTASGISIYLSC